MAEDWEELPLDVADDWEDVTATTEAEPELAAQPASSVSNREAAVRGAVQGFPFVGSYADEATGALESAAGSLGLVPDKTYQQARDESRAAYAAAQKENPVPFYSGMVATSLPLDAAKMVPGLGQAVGAAEGAVYGLGASEADLTKGEYGRAAFDTGVGGAVGAVAPKVVQFAGKRIIAPAARGAMNLGNKVSRKLGGFAESLAENATGATGHQATKFDDNAGRELLDRGLVRFGDSPANIANRTASAMDDANRILDDSLRALDDQGVEVNVDNIVVELEKKIASLRSDPSKAGLVRQLENEVQNIVGASQSKIPVSAAEQTKRGYQQKVNWNTPDTNPLNREASGVYKTAVEETATAANPALGNQFKAAKETYGLLSPIQEAAEKRASTLKQQQIGGLLDLAAGAYGLSNPDSVTGTAALGFASRRFVLPRVASSAAVTMDKLSRVLKSSPQSLGKFSGVLQSASQRGGTAMAATHFTLMQEYPEWREMMRQFEGAPE